MVARLDALIDRVLARLTMRTIGVTVHGAAFVARAYWSATDSLRDLSIERDIPYGRLPAQKLDVYRLRESSGPRPVLLYLHGGGFQQMSSRTHAWFAVQFARAGYLVFNADYRLAPRHPYPAASDDARTAAEFVLEHAQRWGGLATDLTVAGESAGANLALGLAISERPCVPQAVVLFSGLLQVTHPSRLNHAGLSRLLRARIASIPSDYIGAHARDSAPRQVDPLLDPLLWIERHPQLARRLPAIYASVGSADPVAADTLRLRSVLTQLGVPHRVDVYPGEPHAFQAMPMRRHAKASWESCLQFLRDSRTCAHARADRPAPLT